MSELNPGDIVKVEAISYGAKGDAVCKYDNGYTIILANEKDIELNKIYKVEITRAFRNYAFARVV